MLDEAFFDVVGLAAVKAPGRLALKDIDPNDHKKSPTAMETAGRHLLAPRVGLEPTT